MTGPTPSFGSLRDVTRSLGDVTEHAAENRNGVNSRTVRFIVIYRRYLRRPAPRHRSARGGDATHTSLCGARPGFGKDSRFACYAANNALRSARREDRDRAAAPTAGDFRTEQTALRTPCPNQLADGSGAGAAQAAGTGAPV